MKITKILIQLEPSAGEAENKSITLMRNSDKLWVAVDPITSKERSGLFPGEINLINKIQTEIIQGYNLIEK